MRRGGGLFVAALASLLVAVATVDAAASAQRRLTVPMLANCAGQAAGELCPRPTSPPTRFARIRVGAPRVRVTYVTAATHCSQVRLLVYVDRHLAGKTASLGSNGRGSVSIRVPVDGHRHALSWRAEGFVGGCNVGTLISAGGTIVVRYTAAH